MSPYDGIARIDNVFVEDWEPRYDEYLADEPEYHRIVVAVKRDMDIMGTLSAETFLKGSRPTGARCRMNSKARW